MSELKSLFVSTLRIKFDSKMTNAEESILVTRKLHLRDQPIREQILENPEIKHRGSQLSIINRTRDKNFSADISNTNTGPDKKDPKEKSIKQADILLKILSLLTGSKYNRTKAIIDLLKKSERVLIDARENTRF